MVLLKGIKYLQDTALLFDKLFCLLTFRKVFVSFDFMVESFLKMEL